MSTKPPSSYRFANSNPAIVNGDNAWYDILWRSIRGDFKPLMPPDGGYDAFARKWSCEVEFARIAQRSQEPVVTWLGHVTVLLQVAGLNILTDPTLAPAAGPYGRFGAARKVPAPIAVKDLPTIDVLLISHNHYDHLCDATIDALIASGQRPQIIVPLGLKKWFDKRGIPNVTELDWWRQKDITVNVQGQSVRDSVRIHFTPAQHWSKRTPFDTNASLWGGYMVEWLRADAKSQAEPWRFLFPGDTGYSNDFKAIRERIGAVDFLALPIGAYLPRDFMKNMHVNPDDAVQMLLDLDAKQAMGVHWGTFMLTQEAFDHPPRDLAIALKQRGVPQERVWLMKHGETRAIPVLDSQA
jgi:N-acyl-phosphatidylethanolamine-hydrolysing phospholipase D